MQMSHMPGMRIHLQSVDVVWHLQLIKLLLDVGYDLQLEFGAAQKIKGNTRQQHVDGMLNGNGVRPSRIIAMKAACSHEI